MTENGVKEVLARGEADALISLVTARANGDFIIVKEKASAEKAYFQSRSDQHRALMDELGWVDEEDLDQKALHFYAWQNIQQRSTADMQPRIGVSDAQLVAGG